MALRTFIASDGRSWIVWLVHAGANGPSLGIPHVWLAFQNDDESERRRLVDFRDDWADASDGELERLRLSAALVTHRHWVFDPGASAS